LKRVIRAFLRYLTRRKSLVVLQLLGIAFGVAAAVGMMLASRSALMSMENAIDFLKGGSTHTIARPAGPMEEGLLAKIMSDPAVKYFAPVIDRKVQLRSGDQVRLLGLDPFLDKNVRSITAQIASSRRSCSIPGRYSLTKMLQRPRT
jgi:putative ABC transport system permease protein